MYEAFYNFTIKPFRLTPDQEFCFRHPSYQRAKTYLQYVVGQDEDIVMITGKPGTGKTTLINDLLADLNTENLIVARMECIHMGREDLLRILAFSFNLDVQASEPTDILQNLRQYLIKQRKDGRKALLIVDEAQALSSAALEELRLLHNLQDKGQVLLQVYLVGQEELADLINCPAMTQFRQRMLASYRLEPLTANQTEAYIKHRLRTVGWKGDPTLRDEIFPLIHKFSHGIPRRINLLCNQLLTLGAENGRHELDVHDMSSTVDILRKVRLLAPDAEAESETTTSPTADRQTVSTVSLLKESRAETLTQENLYKSETVRLNSNSLIIPSQENTQKKQPKPRKIWPLALFVLLLGASLLGLFLAMLLTVQKPLMNILFPSEGEQANAHKVELGTNLNISPHSAPSSLISEDNQKSPESRDKTDLMPINEEQEHFQNNSAITQFNHERPNKNELADSQHVSTVGSKRSESGATNERSTAQNDLHRSDPTSVQSDKRLRYFFTQVPIDLLMFSRQKLPQETQANDDLKPRVEQPIELSKKPDEPVVESKPKAMKSPEAKERLEKLLEKAIQQRIEFKISLPAGNNAYETYQKVLKLDPTNKQAKQGIIDLAEYYRERAAYHKEQGSLELSLRLIRRGLRIIPKHPELLALEEEVQRSRGKKNN